jgi:excisionase family DNA binding protein
MDVGITDELITVEDVAALLRVKVSWVYDRINPKHGGRLPHVRLGRYVRFERSAILEFIERQRKGYFPQRRGTP